MGHTHVLDYPLWLFDAAVTEASVPVGGQVGAEPARTPRNPGL